MLRVSLQVQLIDLAERFSNSDATIAPRSRAFAIVTTQHTGVVVPLELRIKIVEGSPPHIDG